jgi:hypothetical protein
VLVAPLDLADKASVAAFVAGWDGPLHILVNNAGITAPPLMRAPERWELQFHEEPVAELPATRRGTAAPGQCSVRSRGSYQPAVEPVRTKLAAGFVKPVHEPKGKP